jgi:hypothetical protein
MQFHIGYHAIGPVVTFVAITSDSVKDLVSIDLSWKSNRIKCCTIIIKLCSIITALPNVIGTRNASELIAIARE